MKSFYYELMKNYGSGETKLEVVLYTLLTNNLKFKKEFLSKAFKTPFDYESAKVEKEVSRTSLKKGRTDIEVTDKEGRKFILELKAGWAYPEDKQLNMYWGIDNVVEVATLTNRIEKKKKEKNTTWEETALLLKDSSEYESVYKFLMDFGPANGKGNILNTNTRYEKDSILFTVSEKKGNFDNEWTGLKLYEKYKVYLIPSPTNAKLKNYAKIEESIKYLAFKWILEKGKVNVDLCDIESIENLDPYEINKKLGENIVWTSPENFSGDHYFIKLKVRESKEFGTYVGPTRHMYFDSNKFYDASTKTIKQLIGKDVFIETNEEETI